MGKKDVSYLLHLRTQPWAVSSLPWWTTPAKYEVLRAVRGTIESYIHTVPFKMFRTPTFPWLK